MNNEYVVYASYGSNLLTERFMRYIAGGSIAGNSTVYEGARDKTHPKDKLPLIVPGNVYMSGRGSFWGEGGVAFFDPHVTGEVRMAGWLITVEQFYDVVAQENGTPLGSVDDLELSEMQPGDEQLLSYNNAYSRIIALPHYENIPCFTFTNPASKAEMVLNSASPAYYDVIFRGLIETFPSESSAVLKHYLDSINTQ